MIIDIFFDESGKHSNKPMIMGAVSIPEKVYFLKTIQDLSEQLQEKKKLIILLSILVIIKWKIEF